MHDFQPVSLNTVFICSVLFESITVETVLEYFFKSISCLCGSYVTRNYLKRDRYDIKCNVPGEDRTYLKYTVSRHYVNVSVHIKFSQKTSIFTLIIVSSP